MKIYRFVCTVPAGEEHPELGGGFDWNKVLVIAAHSEKQARTFFDDSDYKSVTVKEFDLQEGILFVD